MYVSLPYTAAASVGYATDEGLKAKLKKELEANFYPKALKKLNEIIVKNNGHLACGRVNIFYLLNFFVFFFYPTLKQEKYVRRCINI